MKNIDKKCISSRKNIYEKSIFSDTDMICLAENNGFHYLLDIHAEGRVSTDFEWKIISWDAESSKFRPLRGVCACDSAYLYFLSESHFAYPSKI